MRIFFLHSGNEQFVKIDRDLLQVSYDVHDFYAAHKFPADFFRYIRGLGNADILFGWFASWNAFWALLLARALRKPSVLVIGGYDVARLPEADYGHQRGGLEKWISRWAMGLADTLLPFSHYSQQEAEKNAGISIIKMNMIYLGVPDSFGALPLLPKEKMILTVGKVEWSNLKRKGLEPFVRSAAYLPDAQFVLVGDWADRSIEYLRSIASKNVVFTGRISDEELAGYYRRAAVYVQASLHEGFGLSVAEAMLAGCIPVTTRAGSMPEVVGECGLYCDSPDPAEIARVVELALDSSPTLRGQARERILDHFSLQQRQQLLEEVIRSVWRNINEKS